MKQKLDKLRTLSIALYEAGQAEKRKQKPEIWGDDRNRIYRDMPSEGAKVWDAIAMEAVRRCGTPKD